MTPASTEDLLGHMGAPATVHSSSLTQSDLDSLRTLQQDLPLSSMENMGYNQVMTFYQFSLKLFAYFNIFVALPFLVIPSINPFYCLYCFIYVSW